MCIIQVSPASLWSYKININSTKWRYICPCATSYSLAQYNWHKLTKMKEYHPLCLPQQNIGISSLCIQLPAGPLSIFFLALYNWHKIIKMKMHHPMYFQCLSDPILTRIKTYHRCVPSLSLALSTQQNKCIWSPVPPASLWPSTINIISSKWGCIIPCASIFCLALHNWHKPIKIKVLVYHPMCFQLGSDPLQSA